MSAKRTEPTMTGLLRKALAECGNYLAVARATGVARMSMMLFLKGGSLRLDKADALARHFGIRVSASRRRPRRGKGTVKRGKRIA